MKIVYITPTYFDDSSLIGGGERYVTELASFMARVADTTLVSFSSERKTYNKEQLKIEIYPVKYFIHNSKLNPFSLRYLSSVLDADIVHIHQINTLVSDLTCLASFLLGKRVFVTDHGGGGSVVINHKIPIFKWYKNTMMQSRYILQYLPIELQKKAVLVKGGIDVEKFSPDHSVVKENKILYVGRILPNKGVNYLIEAFRLLNRSDYKLTIVGRVYSQEFYQYLKELAVGLPVEFVHDADDQRVLNEYRTALVTVLPSVHTNCYGDYTPVPELMGFTLLESQACGTPVICTDAGAMPEFVDPGRTGLVVQQNSGEAIANALRQLLDLSTTERLAYQERCHRWIEPLSWSTVVQKHLEIYQGTAPF